MQRCLSPLAALCVLAMAAACSTESPAGGSNSITAPTPVFPPMGAQLSYSTQPLTLVVQNAVTTGKQASTYTFEVASDAGFASIVAKKENVAEGSGNTGVKLDGNLAGGKGYYWRARANDGSVAGPNSPVINFSVGAAVDLQAPQPEAPDANATVGPRPTFVIRNAARSGPVGTIYYRFEVSDSTSFGGSAVQATVQEQGGPTGQTSWVPDVDLPTGKTLYWHVRTTDPANNISSAYSNTRSFGVSKTGDEIDPATITWLTEVSEDVSDWRITSEVTSVSIDTRTICVDHTKAGQWPIANIFGDGTPIEGNMVFVANIGGKWYAASIDWLKTGVVCKGMTADEIGVDQVRVPPMDGSWPGPRMGDKVGLLMTTPSSNRIYMRTVNERTNIKLVTWPY
jgi:hypothetical protein